MSFETNKFSVVRKKRLERSQFNVECNIDIDVEIDKILSVCHTAVIENSEILNGVVNYSGNVDLCIVYSTIDGEVGTVSASCPFIGKVEDGSISVSDKIAVNVEVEDYQIDAVTNANIKISCNCQQSALLIQNKDVDFVASGDEGLCFKEDEIYISTLIGEAKSIFNVESQTSIKEPIRKVILTDSQVSIKTVDSGINFVSVGGEVVTRILYLTEKDRFETSYLTESFKEEVELNGVTKDSLSEASAQVKKALVRCELVENEKGVDIKMVVPIEVKVVAFEEKQQSVVKDIYSTEGELSIVTESFEMTKQYHNENFDAKIDGSLTLDDDKPRVDKILFVGGSNLAITNAYLSGGEVFVEGIAKTNVIYLNDETNSLNSVIMEVPFVVSDKTTIECENSSIIAQASIVDVDVVVKKGREFYFDAKLKINAEIYCEMVGAVISKIDMTEKYAEKDCAIEVVFGQAGQTAWDIAKQVKVREETIFMQNPTVNFPLDKDENIVIFYQKKN
ncbi:MAG: DUF3794 domain-containing protein [Clostridia bacterium]|nr:DUF3794 domain-containing protein [Clostridia bacterium]